MYFILNGEAASDGEFRALVGRLREGGIEVEVRVSWEDGQTRRFTQEALKEGAELVVGCGGDGTLHEIVNAVMQSEERPVVAGIPYGTGNDFLRSLAVAPRSGPVEFEGWLGEEPRRVDVGRVSGRYFLNMATLGAGALISSEASPALKGFAGSFAYFVRAIPAAFDLPVCLVCVQGAEFSWSGEAAFLFVGNGAFSGGGWQFCPAASLDDGLLDVVIVPPLGLGEMAKYIREMVKAEAPGDFGPVVYRQLPEVAVEFSEETPLNLDGEPYRRGRLEFSAAKRALRFLVPPRGESLGGESSG